MAILRNKLRTLIAASFAGLAAYIMLGACLGYGQTPNSCLDCHSVLPDPYGVTTDQFSHDIHEQKGLTCASCHGGDPTSNDPAVAMSPAKGWKGHIDRKQVPALCASCHSNPVYMKQFNPGLRTDQLDQYHTSVHGKKLAAGDTKVAVCTDCHSIHDLRAPSDPLSTVNPVNVAKTCSRCHADAAYMKPYGIPTDQFANYNTSVHHDAMAVRGDLSAPTCTTCHGNHGATPPGVDKVQNVCGTCHVFQAQMYAKSTHSKIFAEKGLPGCVVCHSNHDIHMPSDAMLGTGPAGVCMSCHKPGDVSDVARANILTNLTTLDHNIKDADQALKLAEASGMEVSTARMNQAAANDALTQARVTVHTYDPALVNQNVQVGMKIAAANLKAGQDAMIERNHRRIGLGVCLVAIGFMLVGLWLYIKRIG